MPLVGRVVGVRSVGGRRENLVVTTLERHPGVEARLPVQIEPDGLGAHLGLGGMILIDGHDIVHARRGEQALVLAQRKSVLGVEPLHHSEGRSDPVPGRAAAVRRGLVLEAVSPFAAGVRPDDLFVERLHYVVAEPVLHRICRLKVSVEETVVHVKLVAGLLRDPDGLGESLLRPLPFHRIVLQRHQLCPVLALEIRKELGIAVEQRGGRRKQHPGLQGFGDHACRKSVVQHRTLGRETRRGLVQFVTDEIDALVVRCPGLVVRSHRQDVRLLVDDDDRAVAP